MRSSALSCFCAALLAVLLAAPARAQVFDNFTDGDFTQNPVWQGDAPDFTVDAQRLRSNGPAVTTTIRSLATTSRVSGAATWEFFANLKVATSSGNLAEVYLTSDSLRLRGANHGYFVRLGNTLDEVSLYRKDGTSSVLLVDGADGLLASTTDNLVRVRVTRDVAGEWTLEADPTGGTLFQLQGTAVDTVYRRSSWAGVLVRYSAANAQKYFFDDFRITDTTPPAVRRVIVTSATTLRVIFDEPLNAAAAASAYTVAGQGAASAATLDPQDDAVLNLTFATAFSNGAHTLSIATAQDLYGNAIAAPLTAPFTYTVPPAVPVAGDVRLNELYVDASPPVGLPATPFVEVLNTTTTKTFSLAGWKLQDATGASGTLTAGTLAPGQYAVLCRTADTATYRTFLGAAVRIVGVTSWPSLNLAGDDVRLLSPASLLIDRVIYTDDWYQDAAKDGGGWSLEQINPGPAACATAANWRASNDPSGGTPGRQNSIFDPTPDTTPPALLGVSIRNPTTLVVVFSEPIDTLSAGLSAFSLAPTLGITAADYRTDSARFVVLTLSAPLVVGTTYTLTATAIRDCAGNQSVTPLTATVRIAPPADLPAAGEVRINELYVDPNPVVGLPAKPFVEILNVTTTKTFELANWLLVDATNDEGTLSAGRLGPGQYAVLVSAADTAAYRTLLGAGVRIVGITSPASLNVTGDDVRLLTNTNLLLDRVRYSDDWYQDGTKDDGGWSLEQINPGPNVCTTATNWRASNDPSGGTPGRQNSIFDPAPDTTPPTLAGVTARTPTTLVVEFSEAIDTLSAGPGAFALTPALGITATAFSVDSARFVVLTLAGPLTAGIRYTLTATGVRDCSGNQSTVPLTTSFGLGDAPSLYEVEITEIFADEAPQVNLPTSEYVEIHNPTSRVLALGGVTFRKQGATGSAAVFPAGATLGPGQYGIVCGSTRGPLFAPYGAPVFALTNFPTLSSAGDTLVLRRSNGALLFSVAYTDDWYRDETKQEGGWALEMIDPTRPCGGAENWVASNDPRGGSPGAPNASVAASLPDVTPPALESASVLTPYAIVVRFTEKVDSVTAAAAARYSLDGSSGPLVTIVQVRGPELREVTLGLSAPLAVGQPRTLSVSGLTDCEGNVPGQPLTIQILVPDNPRRGDVVINEVLFNPRSGGVDFVEVYNRSTRNLDLRGWRLANTREDTLYQLRPLPGFPLAPGQLVALSVAPDSLARQYPRSSDRSRMVLVTSFPSYPDDAGTVVLLAQDTTELDRYTYDDSQHQALLTNDDGVSLERLDPNGPSEPGNFASAASTVDFATPGKPNSQSRTSVTAPTNEVVIDPRVITPDGDGIADFATINYAVPGAGYLANLTIYDSQGRLARRLAANQSLARNGAIQWDGTLDDQSRAPVGYYVLFAEFFDVNGSVKTYKQTVAVGAK